MNRGKKKSWRNLEMIKKLVFEDFTKIACKKWFSTLLVIKVQRKKYDFLSIAK